MFKNEVRQSGWQIIHVIHQLQNFNKSTPAQIHLLLKSDPYEWYLKSTYCIADKQHPSPHPPQNIQQNTIPLKLE